MKIFIVVLAIIFSAIVVSLLMEERFLNKSSKKIVAGIPINLLDLKWQLKGRGKVRIRFHCRHTDYSFEKEIEQANIATLRGIVYLGSGYHMYLPNGRYMPNEENPRDIIFYEEV